MKVLQINSVINSGSTGKIAEDIGKFLIHENNESHIAYGRNSRPSHSNRVKIGNKKTQTIHLLYTLLLDKQGFASKRSTLKFIEHIKDIKPDIIHLHNLHGYYINIKVLFECIKKIQKPVVWTFHDAWPFTGHCAYFDRANCFKWQKECHHCPLTKAYPASWLIDNSRKNFRQKGEIFNGLKNCTIVTPSKWLANHVKQSFLKNYPVKVIHNGVDQETFYPKENQREILKKYNIPEIPYILGVAGIWTKRKGLADFFQLRK